ncbi:DUF6716 putative glycosyltransferase [Microbacterium terricola]|uniref:Uncharacterized protein n=1 Tax=Microbacterium terricola TaxID=344163 RepID=A0ABM8DX18_9MICO|nr:DUF6716 putative glycosyltransferase [Microbacterium terricola]UYK39230.1 hypothetical protein OAU46_11040 [Microbacterium terricola]BDV30050.1 hypothetical protein Microterr_07100 [Microbacterium terricola]
MTARPTAPPRVVAIADADSYVKWAAALLGSVGRAQSRMALVRTPLTVSAEQERAALAGSGVSSTQVERVEYRDLGGWLGDVAPEVVVIAGRGPFVRTVMEQVRTLHPRPVVVTGLPGMSIPAQRGAVHYRRETDLFVVHSRREKRAFRDLAERMGVPLRIGLATLPFAQSSVVRHGGDDLVFAAQAVVPREREDRLRLADILRRAAVAHPDKRVVVKLRSRPEIGENETHYDAAPYPELFHELGELPRNLVFSHEPMVEALAGAEGLVTVSSTAAIEAIARGVPVIAVDTFGISKANLNTVFAGSGVLGDVEDVVERRFRHPAVEWVRDNYFHDPARSTWWHDVEELVEARRAGTLVSPPAPRLRGGRLRTAWDRKAVLGVHDRTVSGWLALRLGMPARSALLWARSLRGNTGKFSWTETETDITLTPALHLEPLRQS